MSRLTDCIAEARDIATAREGDIRLKEFLRAITLHTDPNPDAPTSVSITCENRYWTRYLVQDAIEELGAMSADELATTITVWIQQAFDKNMLSLSNPPIFFTPPLTRSKSVVHHLPSSSMTVFTEDS